MAQTSEEVRSQLSASMSTNYTCAGRFEVGGECEKSFPKSRQRSLAAYSQEPQRTSVFSNNLPGSRYGMETKL
jgi:hypothetical protein